MVIWKRIMHEGRDIAWGIVVYIIVCLKIVNNLLGLPHLILVDRFQTRV